MKERYTKATIATVTIPDTYEFTLNAEIDGANELISLTRIHRNKKKNINENASVTITANELRALNQLLSKIESDTV